MKQLIGLLLGIWIFSALAGIFPYKIVPPHTIKSIALDKVEIASNQFNIDLPGDEQLTFETTKTVKTGITTIRGKQGDNQLLITTDGRNIFGSIKTSRTSYKIDTTKQGIFIVDQSELYSTPIDDISAAPTEARSLAEKIKKYRAENSNESEALPSSQVDIAMFFTPLLEQQLGVQGVRTKAQFLLDLTHEVFGGSGIDVVLNPVFLVRFDEALGAEGNNSLDLYGTEGYSSAPNLLSISFGADLVHILGAPIPTWNACGQAGSINFGHDPGNPVSGKTIVGEGCFDVSFSHEIGHNFDAQHDRPAISDEYENQGGLTDYYYGHYCGGKGTMMNVTLGSNNRHHFFSSPDIIFEGEHCGVPIGQPDAANNVAVFEVTRFLVEDVNPPMPVYGTASFAVDSYIIDDESSVINVELKRTGDLSKEASIELATLDGSAEADADFAHFLQRVEFAEGSATAQVELEILSLQRTVDLDFRLVLRWPFQLTVAGSDVIEVKLAKNVVTPGLAQFANASQSIAENAGTVVLTVSRVNGSDGEIMVNYQTVDGTAKAGTDYTGKSGELTFADGETSKSINIALIDNNTIDGSRSFTVILSGDNLGSTTTAAITINDDDAAKGQAQFATTTHSVAENAGSVVVTVSRVNGSDGEIRVNYQTVDGTAKAGADYTAKSGELVFLEGETSKSISITIINNSAVDGSRSFAVNLSGNNLGATASTSITITDDDQASPPPTDTGSSAGGGSFGWLLFSLIGLARKKIKTDVHEKHEKILYRISR